LRSLTDSRTPGPLTSTRKSVTPPPCRIALVVSSDATSRASASASVSQAVWVARQRSDTALVTASRTSAGRAGTARCGPGGRERGSVVYSSRILRLPAVGRRWSANASDFPFRLTCPVTGKPPGRFPVRCHPDLVRGYVVRMTDVVDSDELLRRIQRARACAAQEER